MHIYFGMSWVPNISISEETSDSTFFEVKCYTIHRNKRLLPLIQTISFSSFDLRPALSLPIAVVLFFDGFWSFRRRHRTWPFRDQQMLFHQVCELPLFGQHRQKSAYKFVVIVGTSAIVHLQITR